MKARLFFLDGSTPNADQNFDEILQRTFSNVLTDNHAIQHFSALKDATVSIGKAFSDSDTVIFFADLKKFADTKDILCKALGLTLTVDEALLSVALKTASDRDLDSAYFNVCHSGVAVDSTVFVLKDGLYAGFSCKRGHQTVLLLPYSGDRTRVLLTTQVIPYLNDNFGANINMEPLQYYDAQQLAVSAKREGVKVALAGTKTAAVFKKYAAHTPELSQRILTGTKAERRGITPPNEYVVNLSITAAEFVGVPYGIAISNAYYVGDDPNAAKTVYVAVTNDSETTVREIHSFYGEDTGDFLFRCCGELCKLLCRIIDNDAGMAVVRQADAAKQEKERKIISKYKSAIAAVLALILLIGAGGGYYFHRNAYTLKDWAYSARLTMERIPLVGKLFEEKETTETAPTGDGIPFYTVTDQTETAIGE